MSTQRLTGKFTAEQLEKLAAEYATMPERLSLASIDKLRPFVQKFSDEMLAQVLCVVKVKWISTLATTEARERSLSREQLQKLV